MFAPPPLLSAGTHLERQIQPQRGQQLRRPGSSAEDDAPAPVLAPCRDHLHNGPWFNTSHSLSVPDLTTKLHYHSLKKKSHEMERSNQVVWWESQPKGKPFQAKHGVNAVTKAVVTRPSDFTDRSLTLRSSCARYSGAYPEGG